MDYIEMGKNIKKIRKNRKLTQEQLAEQIDVSSVYISQIETGARKASLETVYNISLALRVTIDELVNSNKSITDTKSIAIERLLHNRTIKEINALEKFLEILTDFR